MEWHLWVSIGCIVVGLLLILAEVTNPGFFIAVPGTVLLGFGVVGLIAGRILFGPGAAWLIPAFGIPATVLTIWAYKKWAPPGPAPLTLSNDNLPGKAGRVERDIPAGDAGRVRVAGQSLRAVADEPLPVGTKVRVISAEGLTITVEKQ